MSGMSEQPRLSGLTKILSNRILFIIHLFTYVAVSLLLILIWVVTIPTAAFFYFTPFFPIFGWGFGIGFHALVYCMYNDKVKYLSELRTQATFKIVFIFHAWFYGSINIFLLILDITTTPDLLWFFWPLGGWGVAFGYHLIGFFTWDEMVEAQKNKLKEKHTDYSEERLKEFASSKVLGIEILLLHLTYFAIINVIVYSTHVWSLIPDATLEQTIEATAGWAVFVGLHLLAYYLLNFVETISIQIKFLILHAFTYIGLIFIGLYEQFSPGQTVFWWHIPVILWAIVFAIHIVIVLKWDSINLPTLEKVKTRFQEGLEEYKYQRITYWILFWRFTFIAHIPVYALGILLLYAQFVAVLGAEITFLVYVMLGWLIGLLVHGAFYLVVVKNIRSFLMWTGIIHIAAYIGGIPLLVTINILVDPTILWSAIALGGWAIGLGAHLLLAFLTKKG